MTATATIIECPKCFGVKRFDAFRHIVGGTCFLCGGVGKVDSASASRWLRKESGIKGGDAQSNTGSNRPAMPSKVVDLGAYGKVTIARHPDGTFVAKDIIVPADEDACGLPCPLSLWFRVVGGVVVVDESVMQYGMKNEWRKVRAALQSALRA